VFHVLLVEPNDDMCLSLWHIVLKAGGRVTITDTLAEAHKVLCAGELDLLITDATLPDGGVSSLLKDAVSLGIPFFVVRTVEDGIDILDGDGSAFCGTDTDAIEFVAAALRRALALWPRTCDDHDGGEVLCAAGS
jgi:CheY-like chemotaxis protein